METAAHQQQPPAPAPAPAARRSAAPVQPLPQPAPGAAPRSPLAGVDIREMTSATLQAVEGSPGSWVQVLAGTVLRAGLIGGALYFTPGPKGSKKLGTLATQSVLASSSVTVFLLAAHAIRRRIPQR